MAHSATVNAMPPRTSQVHGGASVPSQIDAHPTSFNFREFVVDGDAANFNSTLWQSIDQRAFVSAQREALEKYNVEKVLRLSKATAAEESQRRTAASAAVGASISISSASKARVAIASDPLVSSTSATSRTSVTQSQPTSPKKTPISQSATSDEAAAFSLARSWQVDGLQVPLLENKPPANTTTTFSPNMPSKPKTSSTSSASSFSNDKKASASVSASKQRSQNISLSTPSFIDIASVPSHSRVSSHSNAILSSSQSHRIEHRPLSKREPEPTSSRPQVVSDLTNTTPRHRQTERQLSSSPPQSRSSSSAHVVAAPPISDSKKLTASARDVRLGLILNPSKENPMPLTPVEPSPPPRSRSADQTSESSSDHSFLTAARNCTKCGKLVLSPRSRPSFEHDPFSLPFSDLIHLFCSSCKTCHCRGCFAVARCPKDCSGGSTCTVRNCCPEVRAVAIFEALSSLDSIFASEAGFTTSAHTGSKQHRQAYIKLLISKADKTMRRFEDTLVRTLRILCIWLQAPTRTAASRSDDDEEGAGLELHPSVARLFSASYLPELIHAFLSNNNVRDWVAHSETYLAILDTLRRMSDSRDLSVVLNEPIRHVDRSPGLQRLVWDQAAISYELDEQGVMFESAPLRDLVKQLEAYRRPLRQLAEKIQFEATVEKVNNLCDGMSYLLLQQVVGCI